jgi:hypothetical protein
MLRISGLLIFALSACNQAFPPTYLDGVPVTASLCGDQQVTPLIGQNRSALNGLTLPPATRIIEPGMAITMDYSAQRLNVEVDGAGKITRAYCG